MVIKTRVTRSRCGRPSRCNPLVCLSLVCVIGKYATFLLIVIRSLESISPFELVNFSFLQPFQLPQIVTYFIFSLDGGIELHCVDMYDLSGDIKSRSWGLSSKQNVS